MTAPSPWFVYVLCSTRITRTYVGITTDVERRVEQHNGAITGGAKATRSGRPWVCGAVYGPFEGRGEASRAEAALKKVRGQARLEASWLRP